MNENIMTQEEFETAQALEQLLSSMFNVEPTKYMVSVSGGSAPEKEHDTFESAAIEAERLAKQFSNRGRVIRVVAVVATLAPAHIWQ